MNNDDTEQTQPDSWLQQERENWDDATKAGAEKYMEIMKKMLDLELVVTHRGEAISAVALIDGKPRRLFRLTRAQKTTPTKIDIHLKWMKTQPAFQSDRSRNDLRTRLEKAVGAKLFPDKKRDGSLNIDGIPAFPASLLEDPRKAARYEKVMSDCIGSLKNPESQAGSE